MSSTSSSPAKPVAGLAATNHPPAPPPTTSSQTFDADRRRNYHPQGPAHPPAAPRKTQGARRQHRNQRRPGARDHIDDEDTLAELRALRNTSSRRGQTSITHLLNIALPPRPHETYHPSYSRSYRRNPSWGVGSGYHAADKARYIHANYRFVVRPTGNYAAQAADADKHIEWDDVLQVIASAESQQAACPICLSEPVAPRMAKCGHIFCLPCLIRFMNTTPPDHPPDKKPQNRWRKCPICDDSVYLTDVRPVRFYAGQECPLPRVGDDVILRLMMRRANNTLALPREGAAEVLQSAVDDVPWHFAANVMDYARIMKGTSGYMEEQYDREIEDLTRQEQEDELLYHEDNEWTQRAIKSVKAAKEKLAELGDTGKDPQPMTAGQTSELSKQPSADQEFYFYTSPPHLYLSPLDIRILKTRYGTFSAFPSTLLPRVEHISMGHVVDDALRKRAKYLSHLPRGCLISFLECDWTDIVPNEILEGFKDEIEKRRRRNREKALQEERERIQAERAEAAALRNARRLASFSGDDDGPVTIKWGDADEDRPPVDPNDFVPLSAVVSTSPSQRPGFSALADMNTSPEGSSTTGAGQLRRTTVWGTPAVDGPPLETLPPQQKVDDGWLDDSEVLKSLGEADLAVQLEALGIESAGPSNSGGGGKRKKRQKITLMSTGGRRGL
ncbi:uncharacterized protein CTHT_0046290 [Thermochaetoides thermophila DSM 1495]|uniref:RING-type domain-containing protein n=1 Tax=Chaetomium thermophilum (strain DSM 1495 / CBS 144.50 / IMI 039719) TaxID=759272 RepID=G0S9L2_CHATD|nr:hypothetical protein CTHT_0046290 [Thermochaetoides thermophila DSM 1495]EGS20123.1 hypothetical protein CTHT_0046290 [Thermochaetoides thermophila DSM 1495]